VPVHQDHAEAGRRDRDQVSPAPRHRRRQPERPDELDRHRDAQRQPFKGQVERQVHQAEDDAEGNHREQVPPAPPPDRRPGDQQQDRHRQGQP
jgi:hypothetical protein